MRPSRVTCLRGAQGGLVPLEGAVVTLRGMGMVQNFETGRDGAYLFREVLPGRYDLTASYPGYAPQSVMIEVRAGEIVEHDFIMGGGGQTGIVKGHVLAKGPGGLVTPLEGALVKLCGNNVWPQYRRTNEHGEYVFEKVKPGDYRLSAHYKGFAPQSVKIEVEPGQTVTHDFILEKLEFGGVEGVVEGETPAGPVLLEGALVRLCGMGHAKYCKTNEFGEYGFEKVMPGKYRLTAMAKDFAPETVEIEVTANQTVTHNFLLMPEVPPGAFVGRVMGDLGDETDRLVPIPGALVRLLDNTGKVVRYTRTNRNGEFAMHRVPPGEYKAVASAKGWLPEAVQIEILSGEVTKHEFVLKRK